MGAMATSITEIVALDTVLCGECGITWAMPRSFLLARQNDGQVFHCPNGHRRAYCDTEAKRLRRELEAEQHARKRAEELRAAALKMADEARHQRDHEATERKKIKTRLGHLKERVKNGVCPCCHRSFSQLARHIAHMHPEFGATEVVDAH